MFDIGWSEILVIAIVIVVVVGPKDLPRMLRAFGRATSKFRAQAGEFRRQFDEALKEAELDGVHDLIRDARSLDPRSGIRDALNPLLSAGEDIKTSLRDAETSIAASASAVNSETLTAPAPEANPAAIGSLSVPGFTSAPAATEQLATAPRPGARKATPKRKNPGSATVTSVAAADSAAIPARRGGKSAPHGVNGKGRGAAGSGPVKAPKMSSSRVSSAAEGGAAKGLANGAPAKPRAGKPASDAGVNGSAKPARAKRTASAKSVPDKRSDT